MQTAVIKALASEELQSALSKIMTACMEKKSSEATMFGVTESTTETKTGGTASRGKGDQGYGSNNPGAG